MKAAFIFMHPFSESMGSVVRTRELAQSLGKSGVEVYIVTPYERSFNLFPKVHVVSASSFVNTIGLSKTIYRLTKFLYYNKAFPSLFSKIDLRSNRIMASMVRGIAKFLVNNGIDVIQVEQDVALPIGIGLKKETGLPLIVDIHNISSEELMAAGILGKDSNAFFALQDATRKGLSETDHTVVVSEGMRDYVINNYGVGPANVSVVPPGGRLIVDKSIIEKRSKPVRVAYAGLVAYRERVDLFVKSIPFVIKRDGNAQFFITNKGEAVKRIKKLAYSLGVTPLFFWYDDYTAANHFLSSCHIGALPSSDDVARRMGTPAKLFNYLSVGLPVVANDVGGWTEIIRKEQIGLLTSDDPKDFGEAIASIACDSRVMREFADNGLELVKNKYNWDVSAGVLLTAYKNLIGEI